MFYILIKYQKKIILQHFYFFLLLLKIFFFLKILCEKKLYIKITQKLLKNFYLKKKKNKRI
jgi:hypothetical protein